MPFGFPSPCQISILIHPRLPAQGGDLRALAVVKLFGPDTKLGDFGTHEMLDICMRNQAGVSSMVDSLRD